MTERHKQKLQSTARIKPINTRIPHPHSTLQLRNPHAGITLTNSSQQGGTRRNQLAFAHTTVEQFMYVNSRLCVCKTDCVNTVDYRFYSELYKA